MSRRNREKRAAKQKNRRRASGAEERVRSGPAYDHRAYDRASLLEHLMVELHDAAMCPEHAPESHAADLLADFGSALRDLDAAADALLARAVARAWQAGWSPSDLHELARRNLEAPAVGYLDEAIVLESKQYAAATLHPRWRADLAALSAGITVSTETPQMWRWASVHAVDHGTALGVMLTVLRMLGTVPVLEPLLPLPGTGHHSTVVVDEVDAKALARVRGLLAKAEATEFAEEAETLSAKAQELMSRYSLHAAVAAHEQGRAPEAAARRMWIDSPYAGAKVLLVQAVATANRCRTVWAEKIGFVTVIGADTDLDFVELLSTSLLVQASRAMLVAGRQNGSGGQSRTRSFRQSFLVSYSSRIGERLDTANAAATAEVGDSRLLPVLAARGRATEELTDRLFPSMKSRSVSVSNGAGWAAGRAAADLAQLDVRRPIAG